MVAQIQGGPKMDFMCLPSDSSFITYFPMRQFISCVLKCLHIRSPLKVHYRSTKSTGAELLAEINIHAHTHNIWYKLAQFTTDCTVVFSMENYAWQIYSMV